MNFTEIRLKVRRFFRANKKLIIIIVIVWAIIFLINFILKNRPEKLTPTTTYTKHKSVLDSGSEVPKEVGIVIEDLLEKYVDCCNEGNYQKAFDMLSDNCKKYAFHDDVKEFMSHVLIKMPTPKRYAIQDYSNMKIGKTDIYIYELKFTDDLLSTGLTGEKYLFTSDKITFYNGKDGLEMSVGDYIFHEDVKRISENEFMKLDIIDRTVNYSIETYTVKITNKSEYTIVVANGTEADEVILNLPNEYRSRSEVYDIVLLPGETKEYEMVFKKFVDDGDDPISLALPLVRVMENYSGTEDVPDEVIKSEADNAISKFSMSVNL